MSHAFPENKTTPLLSGATYDTFLRATLYVLPGIGAFYFALAQIWGFPAATQVLGTIAALETLLGVIIGISKKSYKESDAPYDGAVIVDTTGGTEKWSFEPGIPLSELPRMDSVTLKVLNVDETNSQ